MAALMIDSAQGYEQKRAEGALRNWLRPKQKNLVPTTGQMACYRHLLAHRHCHPAFQFTMSLLFGLHVPASRRASFPSLSDPEVCKREPNLEKISCADLSLYPTLNRYLDCLHFACKVLNHVENHC